MSRVCAPVCVRPPKRQRILMRFSMDLSRERPRQIFIEMGADMAAMHKNVADKKFNSRILTQFLFYSICLTSQASS